MNNLVISQNEHNYETINGNIIEYLYQLTKTFDDNETNSNLTGRLECTHCYQDALNFLVNKYPHLHISATDGTYIRFTDSILGSLLTTKYGDGVGVTTQRASEVDTYDGFLKGNTDITSFDELPLFGITTFLDGSKTFEDCTNLQSINLRNITYIPDYCFKNCTSLTSLGNTNNITRINQEAFLNCNLTGDLEFLSLVRLGGSRTFENNVNITSVKFSSDFISQIYSNDNSNALAESTFSNCTSLKHIYGYDNITRIRNGCFYNCLSLETFDFSNITHLHGSVFKNCKKLSVDLSNFLNITDIDDSCFEGCSSLNGELRLPKLNYLGNYAFNNCTGLTSVVLNGNNITSIGRNPFGGCTNIVTADITGSPKANIFEGLTSLTTITLKPNAEITDLRCKNCSSLTTINNSDSIKSIDNNTFDYCKSLENVNFTNATSVGVNAFRGCSKLKYISLPNVTTINGSAFLECVELTSCTFGNNITSINDSTFFRCNKLETVGNINNDLSQITSIGTMAFRECKALTSINIPNVTSLGQLAFFRCTNLTNISTLNNVTTLYNNTFSDCYKLKSISLPVLESLIGDGIFNECHELTSCTFGNNVTSINNSTFYKCYKLQTVGYENNDLSQITSIGTMAFRECKALTSINISNVTSLGIAAFLACNNLRNISTLNNLTIIEQAVFSDCTNLSLSSDTVLNKLTSIGESAFFNCENLGNNLVNNTLDLGGSITTFGASAFFHCNVNIILRNDELPSGFNDNAFNGFGGNIYVKETTIDAFRAKYPSYSSQFKLISEIE